MQIEKTEYQVLCALYGKETVDSVVKDEDTRSMLLMHNRELTDYQGKKFISLKGREITIQGA